MCFCFPFGSSNSKSKRSSPPRNKKRRDGPPSASLHGGGRRVVVSVDEKRASAERRDIRTSRESAYRDWDDYLYRQQSHRPSPNASRNRAQHRTQLRVDVPDVWHRPVVPESANSSDEMLLNPRPHRSQHPRQRHASQKTLRGHGKRVKSKKSTPEKSGWKNPFSPSPERTPKRRDHRHYQNMDSPSHTQRSYRQQRSSDYSPRENSEPSRSHRQHRPRRHHDSSHRQMTPNTSARRDPDRRFAVLAATNTALEDLRREAFQPSPPPRRERLRRYGGVTIPAASIPYSWDCVSSQTSNGYGEPSSRSRRGR